jgi:uncharacterized membrane protein YgcG
MPVRTRRANKEGGFAMLLVFLMASVIAITLYFEIPRVAMQTQRDKEQILIDRGEQYKRAIQLFVKKAGRYPGDIKDLESFQNQRFLRQRYVDPMTGKDEWRIIHIQNGILTDSKISKPAGPGGDKKDGGSTAGQFVGEQVALGGTGNQQPGGAPNARDRRRASEGGTSTSPAGGAPGSMPGSLPGSLPGGDLSGAQNPNGQNPNGQNLNGQNLNGQNPNGQNPNGQNPNGMPVIPGQTMPGMPGYPGQPTGLTAQPVYPGAPGGINQPGMPNIPGQTGIARGGAIASGNSTGGNSFVGGGGSYVGGGGSYVGGGTATGTTNNTPNQTGTQFPGQMQYPGQPGPPANSQNFGGTPAYPTAPGSQGQPVGFPQPGTTTTGQPNAAADMIRNILTTPRPGGMPTGTVGGQTIGGGIAGVASKSEGEGVKVYNDHSNYGEWEFIFDPQKVKQIPNPNAQGAGANGTPANQMGTPAGQGPGQNGRPLSPGVGGPGFGQGTTVGR